MHLLITLLSLVALQPVDSLPALRAALLGAKPGDRITLAAGTYDGSLFIERLRGTKDKPITLAGADPGNPPTIRATGAECIHLTAPAWIAIENLVLERASGNGVNVDDGGDFNNPSPGITLRNLVVRDIGPKGNCDGIKLSGLADFTVENCTIERWGDGGSGIDMVGCSRGVIVSCTLRHADTAAASGIQMKGGSREITVRACRLENAGRRAVNIGGSTGLQFFRPPHTPGSAASEASAITVEGCTITGSEAAIAFVGCDGATARFNTICRPTRWAFRVLQETRAPGFVPCRAGVVTDNIIVLTQPADRALNIGDATEAASFSFARNLWFSEPTPASKPALPSGEKDGVYCTDPRLIARPDGTYSAPGEHPAARLGAHALPAK